MHPIDFAVFEYAGRPNEEALKFADARGLGKITNTVFRHAAGGALKVEAAKARFEAFDNNVFEDITGPALDLPITFAHALGAGNKLGTAAVVLRDTTAEDTTLTALDGPYWVQGDVYAQGPTGKTATLTVEPGANLRFLENAALYIGYGGVGKLVAKGTAQKPITFDAVQGPWKGIHVYANSSVELDTLSLAGVVDDAFPIELDADSRGSITGLTLKGTKKGVKSCGKATLSGLKADKGVKADEKCQ